MPWRRSTGLVRRAIALSSLLVLAACATTTGSAETDHRAATAVACGAFRPISWSTKDTDPTILEVKAHNAAYKDVCGG